MDKYKTYYQHLETCQLVEIIEESHRYNAEVICYCKHLITNKNESVDSLKEMAKSHFTKRYFNYFRDGGHWISKSIIYNSHFLTREELNYCYNLAKEDYRTYITGATIGMPG